MNAAVQAIERGPGSVGPLERGRAPRLTYIINSFDRGGAELGLVGLARGGLFEGCELTIVGLVRGTGGLEAQLIALGCKVEILIDSPRMRTVDMPRLLLRTWQLLSRGRPDVVIASLPQANLLTRLCASFRRQLTFISFEHNTHLAKRVYEIGYRMTSRRVDWMFADAEFTKASALERLYRVRPAERTVVPLVMFEREAKRTYSFTHGRPFQLVNAARFTTTKNQAALIEATAILLRGGHDLELSLFGDGVERGACEALAVRLGVASRVHFRGFVRDWPQQPADLLVLSSRHEGLCIAALEAMHAGIPVAAPLVGGLRDYANSETVRVLSSVEPETIARAVEAAMNDENGLRAQVAAAARMIDGRFGVAAVQGLYRSINARLQARARSIASMP